MAITVSQTIPFSAESLDLENAQRWNTLLPLIRPSIIAIPTSSNKQTILLDTALATSRSPNIHISAVSTLGNFSSKLLQDRHVTAIVTEQPGSDNLTAKEIADVIRENGSKGSQAGVVVVRVARKRRVEVHGADLIEVEVNGDLELDHVVHLLGTASESTRSSIHQMAELLKLFHLSASTAHSTFDVDKQAANPAVLHADGHAGFEKARHAIERDLKHVMNSQTAQKGSVTYSVHYADVNGLSRLENYIIGLEIAKYLEAQNVPYALSTSTLLQHDKLARGFAISICAIPQHLLAPQAKPSNPLAQEEASQVPPSSKSLTSSIIFSDTDVRRRIEAGCNAVIAQEATITHYDEIVGDGDCGYTLRDGAKQVLAFIATHDLSQLPQTLSELVTDLEVNMGGTSGALYCIFLTALASSLASSASVPEALDGALRQLLLYTRARLGDRTMLDCLIPFVEGLQEGEGGDVVASSLERARRGVEGTKELEATLGRSSYLDDSTTRGVPDPGAFGLLVLLEGMCQ